MAWWALASPVMYPNLVRRRTEDDWLVRNAAANVTELLLHDIVHTRVLPCPAMGVLRKGSIWISFNLNPPLKIAVT